jgi:hypothetical protein
VHVTHPVAAVAALAPAGDRRWSLDGIWDLFPGDHRLHALADLEPVPVQVPGLWEAQGLLELDGVAWYRRRFRLDDPAGHWTLRFGAVMDLAEVHLNGRRLGGNDLPFTPFEVDPSAALAAGVNELAVRVTDPPVSSAEHLRPAPRQAGLGQPGVPEPAQPLHDLRRHLATGDPAPPRAGGHPGGRAAPATPVT